MGPTLEIRRFAREGIASILLLALSQAPACADQITQAQKDSGWVSAFDGKTLAGFYTTLGSGAPNNDPVTNPDGTFSVRASDSSIHATGTPTGHIYTKKVYSHYRVRIREKFDKLGETGQNAGMLYHARIEGPRLFGSYPRSIEYQGQKRGMGEIWTIGNVYVNTTVDSTKSQHQYKAGGKMVDHGNPDGRQCLGSSVPYIDGAWNVMEALVRGSDSAVHIVNGTVVFKCWKMRWSEKDDPKDMANMLNSGSIALQSEGAPVSYRDYMFMELDPATGRPINAKPTLAGEFPAAGKGNLLRAESRDGGWIIRYAFPAAARRPGEAARLSILTMDGRSLDEIDLPGASGEILWSGAGRAAGLPVVLRERISGMTTMTNNRGEAR
ncbi:MAG: hypothetical protein JWP91_957 [Fibrobacteres bacterium]|nr:hypothetical protein [Fibrobacterota bacterium]